MSAPTNNATELRAQLARLRAENARLKALISNDPLSSPPSSSSSSSSVTSIPSRSAASSSSIVVPIGTKKHWQFGDVEKYGASSCTPSSCDVSLQCSNDVKQSLYQPSSCKEMKTASPATCSPPSLSSSSAVTVIPWISRDQLKSLLRAENTMRLSSMMQSRYSEAEATDTSDWMAVTIAMQRTLVCTHLAIDEHDDAKIDEALYALRTAHLAYPEDEEFRTIPLYIKYNITRNGSLRMGDTAPNVDMIPITTAVDTSIHDASRWKITPLPPVKLLDVAPLVRLLLPALHDLANHYGSSARVTIVYTMEAHAQDQWPISSGRWNRGLGPVIYNQPRDMDERLRIVTDFVSVFQPSLPVIVDTMTNAFERAFASWPLRIYVLHRGRAVYIASANDWLPELCGAIDACLPPSLVPAKPLIVRGLSSSPSCVPSPSSS